MNHQDTFRPCAVIPVYNHWLVLDRIVSGLREQALPVFLVDDGSDAQCRERIAAIALQSTDIYVVSRPQNGGKGAAVKDGIRAARAQRFSHAVQMDADGQHDDQDVARFLKCAHEHPMAMVAGYPVYDDTVPAIRFYARYLSHVWLWINTLSTEIKDSMCGFRVYPVNAACELIDERPMGDRMDFDIEFLIRWHQSGQPVEQLATRVIYPKDGISHFRLWRDNVLITRMHARLFLGMLPGLPRRAVRRLVRGKARLGSRTKGGADER